VSNDLYTSEKITADFEVPDIVLPLVLAHPRLLPGETRDQFYLLLDLMVEATLPESTLEWLMTIDLTWLQWEIQRYRRWKNAIIMSNRSGAVEDALCKTHPGCVILDATTTIRAESRMQMQEMRSNPRAHSEVQARLVAHGYDEEALNAAAFVQSMHPLATIEKLLSSARHQVMVTLREMQSRREFERRASETMKHLDANPAPLHKAK
jgi:hypothetical protein